jgi:hypothetical protein
MGTLDLPQGVTLEQLRKAAGKRHCDAVIIDADGRHAECAVYTRQAQ